MHLCKILYLYASFFYLEASISIEMPGNDGSYRNKDR